MSTIHGTTGDDVLAGGSEPDEIFGGDGRDDLDGGDGDDFIDGGAGADTIRGGLGNDRILSVLGGEGEESDRVFEQIDGGEGDDTITIRWGTGWPNFDEVKGGLGFDVMILDLSETDFAEGEFESGPFFFEDGPEGSGQYITGHSWRLYYESVEKVFAGVDITFKLYQVNSGSGIENLVLLGSDSINAHGNGNDNHLIGNEAANYINGRGGDDVMRGEGGDDIYIVNSVGDLVEEQAHEGSDTIRSLVPFTLGTNIENLTLLGSSATGTGNSIANTIIGNASANTLYGLGGADILDGRSGNDVMAGGYGGDTYRVDRSQDRVVEYASSGLDTVISTATFVLGTHVEILELAGSRAIDGTGGRLSNTIIGNGAANVLKGLGGGDHLEGGRGADQLNGGNGNDILIGGRGYDGFNFATPLNPSANVDRILDFTPSQDTIFLSREVFAAIPEGALFATSFRVASDASDDDDHIIYDPASGDIFYDVDGNGPEEPLLFAQVAPGTELTHPDFVAFPA